MIHLIHSSYLNGFKCFLDKLVILTGELLEICIVELRVRVALWTNVPEMIQFNKKIKIKVCTYSSMFSASACSTPMHLP